MKTNQIFQYNGSSITFQKGDNVMVNATEMAKPFNKRPNDFLILKSTNELTNSLSAKTGIPVTGLVIVNQGGNNQGTWMHEDLALVFAQWLSPDFYLWCNDRIKELLQYGMTATQPTLEQMINNPDLVISLATQLKSEREEKQRMVCENQILKEQNKNIIEETKPAVTFANAFSGANSSCLIGELAKIISQNGYEIGEKRMFAWLREKGYLGKHGERYNVPNQKYVEQGLFVIKKGVRSGNNGVLHTTLTTKVSGKGQVYFVNKFLNSL
ncbi:phage antirepressor KilAC domain-containing protein [Bacteroides stercoris]|uniref:phage antirepressor KilAC domain-containing protein n=1 Tax=Bacteroides stercoris TaxID=46506 RepID=UPI00233F1A5A|nr:phage antirepressor KilAC domain-containing protein [Bacteroides stercoris]MDC2304290.1 phage antirepressor KilAC domain-containing protein [Bacteroides stercoris]